MTNEELQNLAIELKDWFDSKMTALKTTAENVKDLDHLTIDINDDITIELTTAAEVKAFRTGILCAQGSIGEFPLEVVKKEES